MRVIGVTDDILCTIHYYISEKLMMLTKKEQHQCYLKINGQDEKKRKKAFLQVFPSQVTTWESMMLNDERNKVGSTTRAQQEEKIPESPSLLYQSRMQDEFCNATLYGYATIKKEKMR